MGQVPGMPPPNNNGGPITIDGVVYSPVPGMPGVYQAPWGQYGYISTDTGSGGYTYDPASGTLKPSAGTTTQKFNAIADSFFNGSGGGGGGASYPPEYTDPRYWQLQYDQLTQQYVNAGLDSESARRQALATLITNRNNTALGIANTSANIAQQEAQFAANPRDAYAEAIYRNAVGGSTPFGDINNSAFGDYGKALAQKASDIFSPVNQDLQTARNYASSIPLPDFLGPAPAVQQILGTQAPTTAPARTTAAPNGLQALMDRLNSFNPQQKADFQNYVTGGAANATPAYATGGTIDFRTRRSSGNISGSGFGSGSAGQFATGGQIRFGGAQPSSSEGGTNMNIHEPAMVVGRSGHVYATLGEGGYPEQLKIVPTPSGKKAALAAEKQGKQLSGMMQGTGAMATGGSATVDDMYDQFNQLLQRLTGASGGGGSTTPFGGARFLAGAPANAIQSDPFLQNITDATYSMKGIDPTELWAQVAKFTPNAPINNLPRVNFAG